MNLNYKYDYHTACKKVIQKELEKMNVQYAYEGISEVKLRKQLSKTQFAQLQETLQEYGIHIIDNPKELLVQRIKDSIVEMIHKGEDQSIYKTSIFLSEKLDYSYGYLSNVFSEVAFTTIENYIILQKIEYVKYLLMKENLSLTEIAYKLNYSSVAHLSSQFKNKTGLTPSSFQRIMQQRKKKQGEEKV